MTKKLFILILLISSFAGYRFVLAQVATEGDTSEDSVTASSSDTAILPNENVSNATTTNEVLSGEQATTTATSTATSSSEIVTNSATSTTPLVQSMEEIVVSTCTLTIEKKPSPELIVENNIPGDIVFPTSNTTIKGTMSIKLRLTNPSVGASNVLFYLSDNNGTFLGETNQPDGEGFYSIEWNSDSTEFSKYGPHYLYAAVLGTPSENSNSAWVPIVIQ